MKEMIRFFIWLGATVLIYFSSSSFANAQVWEEWVALYNGPVNLDDEAKFLAVDADGNVYVTGVSKGVGSGNDYVTVKYDTDGDVLWVARYNGPGNGWDEAKSLAIDTEGNVYVTGFSFDSVSSRDYTTIKYDSWGNEVWVVRYNGPGNHYDEANCIALDEDGNIYVTGQSRASGYNEDYATVKYNSSGVEQWVARYDGPGGHNDMACSMAVDDDGNVYVTGKSDQLGYYPYNYDYATIKYDFVGIEHWVARYNGPGDGTDEANSIDIDSEGNVYVTGGSWGSGTSGDFATIKYNSVGTQLWVARYNGTGNSGDGGHAIAIDIEENVYVTGTSWGTSTHSDYATIKYDSAGVEQWVSSYSGLINDYYDAAYSIALDVEGNAYVTGGSDFFSQWYIHEDYATIKYNPEGIEQWVIRYNGPSDNTDEAGCIAIDAQDGVYVTGFCTGVDNDYATIKYTQTHLPSVLINLTPINPPIQIPASGGSFDFNIEVANNESNPEIFDIWTMVTLPNGSEYGPIINVPEFTAPANWSANRIRTQAVPGNAPEGSYTYDGYVGEYPWEVEHYDSFTFEKLSTDQGGSLRATLDWICTGEEFDAWKTGAELEIPNKITLLGSYPNPFNPSTTISYVLPEAGRITLVISDLRGRLVTTLINGWRDAGVHEVTFDGSNLASGVYIYRIKAGDFVASGKMVLMK
jgi:uncharacterized delta-60 repeat protein